MIIRCLHLKNPEHFQNIKSAHINVMHNNLCHVFWYGNAVWGCDEDRISNSERGAKSIFTRRWGKGAIWEAKHYATLHPMTAVISRIHNTVKEI